MRNILLSILLAIPMAAQNVTAGSQSVTAGTILNSTPPPFTLIDLSHPATANGSLTAASLGWGGGGPCTGAFKLKVFHPSSPNTLLSFTFVGERGPFTAQPGHNHISITPPIDVVKGDLIGVTVLVPFASCGSPKTWFSSGSSTMRSTGDLSSGTFNGFYFRDEALALRATDTPEVLEGVIPAVGSVAGANGSFFRTSLQIGCPGGGTCTGRIVYHPAGAAASPNDQALPYTVSGTTVTSYSDIVSFMGKSGLGTMDVISNDGFPPLVTARVYNDAGANGTSGFTEEMIRATDVLHAGDAAILITPPYLDAFRMNIGVRTLSSAHVVITYGSRFQISKDFPANTFNHYSLAAFGDTNAVANEQISLYVFSGDVAIYASTTDNKTNDSAIRVARRE